MKCKVNFQRNLLGKVIKVISSIYIKLTKVTLWSILLIELSSYWVILNSNVRMHIGHFSQLAFFMWGCFWKKICIVSLIISTFIRVHRSKFRLLSGKFGCFEFFCVNLVNNVVFLEDPITCGYFLLLFELCFQRWKFVYNEVKLADLVVWKRRRVGWGSQFTCLGNRGSTGLGWTSLLPPTRNPLH